MQWLHCIGFMQRDASGSETPMDLPARSDAAQARRMAMRPARIWVVSKGQMSEWMHRLEPQYRGRAHIGFIDETFDAALARVRELEAQQAVDVLVTAGANGAYLRRLVRSPIAMVRISGFDVLRGLARAGALAQRVALMTHDDLQPELDDLRQLTPLTITARRYAQPADAEATMRELIADGHTVFLGPSLITSLAERLGVTGVFIYSERSLRQALDDAIELTAMTFEEQWRRAQLETVLERIEQGVIGVDLNGHVWSMNGRMEQILGVTRDWALGKPLRDVAPALSVQSTLRTGTPQANAIERIGHRTVVVNRVPVLSDGQVTGAVLTCQEAGAIRKAEEVIRRSAHPRTLRARYRLEDIVGTSPVMTRLRAQARLWAASDSTILITGESGTGKEMLAQGIHQASARHAGPFVAINCAAIPETLIESELFGHDEGAFTGARRGGRAGLIEAAHQGTLFLDEVTEMPLSAQARLLRVLQEREVLRVGATEPVPVDLRFIAATNRAPARLIDEGRLRADLYFRLNVLGLPVPPLRERRDDIPDIARRWLAQAARRLLPDGWLEAWWPALMRYHWPGNVRELENVLERLLACATAVQADPASPAAALAADLRAIAPELFAQALPLMAAPSLPPTSVPGGAVRLPPLPRRTGRVTDAQIHQALADANGHVTRAAQALGVSRTTLWRRSRDAGLDGAVDTRAPEPGSARGPAR